MLGTVYVGRGGWDGKIWDHLEVSGQLDVSLMSACVQSRPESGTTVPAPSKGGEGEEGTRLRGWQTLSHPHLRPREGPVVLSPSADTQIFEEVLSLFVFIFLSLSLYIFSGSPPLYLSLYLALSLSLFLALSLSLSLSISLSPRWACTPKGVLNSSLQTDISHVHDLAPPLHTCI